MIHAGMDMPSHGPKCNMNVSHLPHLHTIPSPILILSSQMLFTWGTTDLCIIFPQWHISSTFTLLLSLLGVVLLTAGYELVREASRRYESSSAEHMSSLPSKFSGPA